MVYHVEKPDGVIREILANTFPHYKGKQIKISTNIPNRLDSYWDGRSRDTWAFYDLENGTKYRVQTNHPFFEREKPRDLDPASLPKSTVIVCHSIFCGKDTGITIYAHQDVIAPLLPSPEQITADELTVLQYTSALKNTYGGRTDIRFQEAREERKITREQWDTAQASCIAKGWLNKSGAITAKGRNQIPSRY